MILCLRVDGWPPAEEDEEALVARLAACAPRLAVQRSGVVWADVRGLPAGGVARRLRQEAGRVAGAGVAAVPIAAWAAAWSAGAGRTAGSADAAGAARAARAARVARVARADRAAAAVAAAARADPGRPPDLVTVAVGEERAFLAPLPLAVLEPETRVRDLLEGVGIERCGELAALEREPVEVRFGVEGVRLWRLARAEDRRRLFAPARGERPCGSIDFVDYAVTDPARLLFTTNALLGSLCETLVERGEHARRLSLDLALDGGGTWRRTFRAARPTASRERWLRLIRDALERLTLPDSVVGVALAVDAAEPAATHQGDLFDRGFATAAAVEAAVARLLDTMGPVVVAPETDRHPLPERRTRWRVRDDVAPAAAASSSAAPAPAAHPGLAAPEAAAATPALTPQLLPEPRPIRVDVGRERGHEVPRRYRERGRRIELVTVAGPDRLSGGQWEAPYAREYFRCLTGDGVLVWLFRDARTDRWFLHGWWD